MNSMLTYGQATASFEAYLTLLGTGWCYLHHTRRLDGNISHTHSGTSDAKASSHHFT